MPVPPSAHPAEAPLPTLSKLGDPLIPADLDAAKVATEWLVSFAKFTEQGDINGILSLIVDSQFFSNALKPASTNNNTGTSLNHSDTDFAVYWRDILVLTWDFRTFEGTPKIKQFLVDRLDQCKTISNIQLQNGSQLVKPYPDLAWIQLSFSFETQSGLGTGIVRLVPVSLGPNSNGNAVWKAQSIFTNLDGLKGFPEKVGALRNDESNHGKWEAERAKEVRFEDQDPKVLVVGAGHSGLAVAARLKALDISALVVDKNDRIGDNWRTRYEALCLHDPVCEWDLTIRLINN
jgi:NAD(P)-binding Rossmann-like domain